MKVVLAVAIIALFVVGCQQAPDGQEAAGFQARIIFPYQEEHVHGSTIVALPNGDLLAAWFQGSGERWADDVRIMGSRLVHHDTAWSAPFVMADVAGFPDINPILFMDKQQRLWLMWYPVLANQWETSIPMYRISENYKAAGAPVWTWQDVLFVKAGDKTERGILPDDSFVRQVDEQLTAYEAYLKETLLPQWPDSLKVPLQKEWGRYKEKMDSLSKGENMLRSGKGYPLTRRLGWQTKNKAIFAGDRMVVPLYSDGFDCSLFAITDDGGKTWRYSNPVLGGAGIQPTVALAKDGKLVAYLRDNGPVPHRMQRTESTDQGLTWSIAKDDQLPNPGSGFDMTTLSTGEWLMVFNNTEQGRHNLTVALSDDEGKTWKWKKNLEDDLRDKNTTTSHYPAIITDADNRIHITYSYHRSDTTPGKTIKYVSFPITWLKQP